MSIIKLATMALAFGAALEINHQKANREKKQECVDKYWDASQYPRKKKKALRKKAIWEYNFWCKMAELEKNNYNL